MDYQQPQFGSVKYYQDQFEDILCDASDSDTKTLPNMLEGLLAALQSWIDYHGSCKTRYQEFQKQLAEAVNNV